MMAKNFSGNVLFLNRSDINTDEIIPARHLTGISKEALKPYLFEDIRLEMFDPERDVAGKSIIISRSNFGCGSSREHAVWALAANGINLVIAQSFARIFKQNMFNCGMMAVELPRETIQKLFVKFSGSETVVKTDLDHHCFTFQAERCEESIPFHLSAFDEALVKAGGWLEYADKRY